MTQPEMAVGGAGDTVVAAEPTLEDRFAAFGDEPQEEEAPPPVGEDDPPLEVDPADLEDEVAELPPIVAPVSWTAEEKEEFAELPRALQETLTRREAEREKFVQTKAQEVKAATHKAEQQALEAITQANNAHVQQLRALLPQIPEKPSARLQLTHPEAYANAIDAHEWAIAQHQQAQQVVQQIAARQQQAEAQAQSLQDEYNEKLLRENFPEYFDETKGPELRKQLQSTALELGYSADQLANVDAHDVLAMKAVSELRADALKYRTLMAKQMEKVRDAKKLPRVSRPGVPQGKGAVDGQRYAADRQAMQRGDRDAAARVFSKFL